MPEKGYNPGAPDIVTECLASDGLIMYLAEDIVEGELELDVTYPFLTDQLEYLEACEEVRSTYGVTQPQVEQAIEHAKAKIRSGQYGQA